MVLGVITLRCLFDSQGELVIGALVCTILELSGRTAAGDRGLRVTSILVLFSQRTGRIHLRKSINREDTGGWWSLGF